MDSQVILGMGTHAHVQAVDTRLVCINYTVHCNTHWVGLTWVTLLEFQCCDLHTNNPMLYGCSAAAMQ